MAKELKFKQDDRGIFQPVVAEKKAAKKEEKKE